MLDDILDLYLVWNLWLTKLALCPREFILVLLERSLIWHNIIPVSRVLCNTRICITTIYALLRCLEVVHVGIFLRHTDIFHWWLLLHTWALRHAFIWKHLRILLLLLPNRPGIGLWLGIKKFNLSVLKESLFNMLRFTNHSQVQLIIAHLKCVGSIFLLHWYLSLRS